MDKEFNTTGPCRPGMHYMLPPAARLDAASLQRFIQKELYWVLHAPRQTGKTSFLMAWMKELNESAQVVACYVSVERCQGIEEMEIAIPLVCESISARANLELPPECRPEPVSAEPGALLHLLLQTWAQKLGDRKLVLLFDEVDVLSGPALVSFLRQLRDGFAGRGAGRFPVSVALVGMRDLKDYLVFSKDGVPLNPGSPFNIKKESFSLRNFSESEVANLLSQHTEATGQLFTAPAISKIYEFTCGQPWLVNSLADYCINKIVPVGDPIDAEHIEAAKEALIKSRAVHIDSLAERLKDPRVKRVVQPILAGDIDPEIGEGDDFRMCLDLGLVALENGSPAISNPIYREVLIRTLNYGQQLAIPQPEYRWQKDNGDLDMETLMTEFQAFWREHGELWEQKADYTEVFPHLLLMAFFQRLLNGGAKLTREAAAGRERMDMLIEWKGFRHIIEIKLVHPRHGRDYTLEKGLKQIARYHDTVGEATQTLALFDRTPKGRKMSWAKRLKREQHGEVTVWWM